MINKTLMKQTIKSNWGLWAILTGVQVFFLCAMVLGGKISVMVTGLTYYGLLPGLISAVYVCVTANKLIASQVDKGTMAYILSTPVNRSRVAITQLTYFVGSIFAMYLISGLAHIVCHTIAFKGITGVDAGMIISLSVGLFVLNVALSGICFLASSYYNLSKYVIALGGGAVGAFHLLAIMGMFGETFRWMRNISLVSLFDVNSILSDGAAYIWKFIVLGVVGVITYTLGCIAFTKRDLPL